MKATGCGIVLKGQGTVAGLALAISMVLVVLNQNGFTSPSNPNPYPQDIWQCLGTFLAITVGMVVGRGGSAGIQLIAAPHTTVHR